MAVKATNFACFSSFYKNWLYSKVPCFLNGATTFRVMAFSIVTFSVTAFSLTTISIMICIMTILSIMTFSITILCHHTR
jgi:hypothetical protein